jgi:RimJ/RimL family protein N-acetyltransferase
VPEWGAPPRSVLVFSRVSETGYGTAGGAPEAAHCYNRKSTAMPQERTGYVLQLEQLGVDPEPFGWAAIVPWDSVLFGFPVAQYRIGCETLEEPQVQTCRYAIASWLENNRVLLCSSTIPAHNRFWKACLPQMGFQFVDLGLRAVLNGLQKARLRPARSVLRLANPDDREAVEAIAGAAFHHGRYHADPRFPRHLADLRYRNWVAKAFAGGNPVERLYVMGEPGQVQGFYHMTVEDGASDLRLAAISPEVQGTMLGFDLYLAMLHTLRDLGIRRVATSISATNTAVMNVFSMLGFQFAEPEATYHWHASSAGPGAI